MTDDSPYQDAKEFREAVRQAGQKLDNFFRHSTGKVIGPAATKAREGLKNWWGNRQKAKALANIKKETDAIIARNAPQKPAEASKTWWPPFGWGQGSDASPDPLGGTFDSISARNERAEPLEPLDQLEPLDPALPDEMTD